LRGANSSFIDVVMPKLVMHFLFAILFLYFLHVGTSFLRNCLFVCLLAFLLFDIICAFPCLPLFFAVLLRFA